MVWLECGMGVEIVLACWQHEEQQGGQSFVLPDGCQDVILTRHAEGLSCFVSSLARAPHAVHAEIGTQYQGFRLRAGASIDERVLELVLSADGDFQRQKELVEDHCRIDRDTEEVLACIAVSNAEVAGIAAELGVSSRTLQRLLMRSTGKTPSFWRQLARVRRAAQALGPARSLVDLAYEFGFADQPHMSREFVRWFGVPPLVFASQADLNQQIKAKGYAN